MTRKRWQAVVASGVVAVLVACTAVKPPEKPAEPGTRAASPAKPRIVIAPPGPFEIRLAARSFTPDAASPDWSALFVQTDAVKVRAIVQLKATPDARTRAALSDAGVELGQPLTGRAYLASVKRGLDRNAAALAAVRWVGPYGAGEKLAPELSAERGAAWARRTAGRVEVVVKLFPDSDFDAAISRAKALGGSVLGEARAVQMFSVALPAGRERELAQLDAVRFIEPGVPPGRGESDRARSFLGATVGAIAAGDANGQGVIVGVFDAQHVRLTHPDFDTRAQQGDTGALDEHGHPTMTAGMIAGSGARSVANGAASANQWRGIAPAASIRSYNFTTTADPVTDYVNDVTDAVQNDGVNVLNNSWGDSDCNDFAYGGYLGRAPFLDGVVGGSLGRAVSIVFSAGNDRDGFFNSNTNANDTGCITNTTAPFNNYTTINHPKAAKNVIVVGAIDSGNGAMTTYSSWGSTLDGRIKPEVVAAGHHNGSMTSGVSDLTQPFGSPTGAANQQDYRVPFYEPNNNFVYGWFSQTSSAAAEVSGTLALMIDGWRRAFPGRADPLPSTLRAALVHNALDIDDATTWFNRGPDYASGYGRVQANDSVASLARGDALEDSVAHLGEARYYVGVATGAGPLKITLAWDDAPAIEGANPALINDLDLVVTDPSGVRHYPWTLDPANPAAAAVRTAEDHVNNLEQVVVDAPAAGTWTVVVRGTNVASAGSQTFSIVTLNGFRRRPLDLVLALDTSDSMNDLAAPGAPPKIQILRSSAQLLLETWNLHAIDADRVGFAAFSSDVTTTPSTLPALQPFLPNVTAMTNAALALTASNCTALGGALQLGLSSFDPSSPSKRAIIVATDGMQSANPFVGEAGSPSRLRIANFAPGAALPFGAFYCTQAGAKGPGGTAIVPDGIDVAAHGAEIHTIGIGVNGTGFQQLLDRLATENNGTEHFTTSADVNLDMLYINELVRALKSNTLEVITTDSGTLAVGTSRDIAFPVNSTVRSITVVLSWSGSNQVGAVDARMHGPGGGLLAPDRTRQQGNFTLLKFDLPGKGGAHAGNWRLTLSRAGAPAIGHQLTIIADESCLHYDFAAGSGAHRAGEALPLSARVAEAGRAPAQALNVRAQVAAPLIAPGNLLSTYVPRTAVAKKYLVAVNSGRSSGVPPAGAVLEAAIAELNRDPAFLKLASGVEATSIALKPGSAKEAALHAAGAGWYASTTTKLSRAGAYRIAWSVEGGGACGLVQRQELGGIVVGLARLDRERSVVGVTIGPRVTVSVVVRPIDVAGNLLGPGMGSQIAITVEGAKPVMPLVDLLDGSYRQVLSGRIKGPVSVRVAAGGESWNATLPPKPLRASSKQR